MEQERGYVAKEGKTLKPESRGRVLTEFLLAYFPRYVDYSFTASLEDELDEVAGALIAIQIGLPVAYRLHLPF